MKDSKNRIEKKAHLLWGQDLHHQTNAPVHYTQLAEIFKERWHHALQGNLLEIGCGSGSDLEFFSTQASLHGITAIDLGLNVAELAKKYQDRKDITVQQGNALSLEFQNSTFDMVYSFGVFHHTVDPVQCLREAYRVLKKEGVLFLYLYGAHEDNILKRVGIFLENFVMNLFSKIPYKHQSFFCLILSPVCWLIFAVPSNLLRLIGMEALAKKFPFYFGTHPFSLISDLKDRLMSPINHRFTQKKMQEILLANNFDEFDVVKTSAGLYIYAKKS